MTPLQRIRSASRHLRVAGDALRTLRDAREGSWVSRGLAVASVVGLVIEHVTPETSLVEQLGARGLKRVPTHFGAFVAQALANLPAEQVTVRTESATIFGGDVAVTSEGSIVYARSVEVYRDRLQAAVWTGADLSATLDEDGAVALVEMKPPGAYFGEPSLAYLAERLRRRGAGARSILLVGCTGSGKSTLGRLLAREMANGRTLKFPAKALGDRSGHMILDLVRDLAPTVLLIDDMQDMLGDGNYGSSHVLSVLEELHGHQALLVGTVMVDSQHESRGRYMSGLRPGRFDEVVLVPRPNAEVRRRILRHYAPDVVWSDDIIRATSGLSGAYLAELATRVTIHGLQGWKAEVTNLKRFSPMPIRRHSEGRSMVYNLWRRLDKLEDWVQQHNATLPVDVDAEVDAPAAAPASPT